MGRPKDLTRSQKKNGKKDSKTKATPAQSSSPTSSSSLPQDTSTPQVTSPGGGTPTITDTPITPTVTPTTPTVTPTVTSTPTGTPLISCPLKSASNIVVLGSSTVTSVGATVLNGDVVATTITGFGPGTINGAQHTTDAVASQATTDLTSAFTSLAAPACDVNPTAMELGGSTLTPGVYCFQASAQITGSLTLDGQNNPNAQFIFRIPSTLSTADSAAVVLTNGALACNIFFVVGSSASLGGVNNFNGNILASSSVSLNDGTIVNGNLYANTGAVTLIRNTVTKPTGCGC